MEFFAIGVGGSGAKCIEALTHLHACGLLTDLDHRPVRLNTFLIEPDQESTLLHRAKTAIERYAKMHSMLRKKPISFGRGELMHYGTWNPLSSTSGAIRLDQIFAKPALRTQASGLADLFDCLFPPEEQEAHLGVGFRGRPPIGAAVMSRVSLASEAQTGQWQKMLGDVKTRSGNGESTIIHLFGSVFGGTGAAGVPTLGQMLKNWLLDENLLSVRVHASLLLPYFDFEGQGQEDTGVHAEARNFQLNTDAALQHLCARGQSCFDHVYLTGSAIKARYEFSIGGRSQENSAHLIELLAALGARHGLSPTDSDSCAYVLSRAAQNKISWTDIPDHDTVGVGLSRAARFSVAWLNNFSLELDRAQTVPMSTFLSGAPWSSQFFHPRGLQSEAPGGRPSIRSPDEQSIKTAVDAYSETLLQWLYQVASNTGSDFKQELFNPDLLKRNSNYLYDLALVVRGSARPTRDERDDTVGSIKVLMDKLPKQQVRSRGVAGLVDILWDNAY
jgi:hypothetical protein